MSKSTIGMILLVGMVISKAVISVDQRNSGENSAKTELSPDFNFSERTFDLVNPKADLLAQQLFSDDYSALKVVPVIEEVSNNTIANQTNFTNEAHEFTEEVRPLESGSTVGYGMWVGETESLEKVDESTPLDNGNTISANISKLFPRTQ